KSELALGNNRSGRQKLQKLPVEVRFPLYSSRSLLAIDFTQLLRAQQSKLRCGFTNLPKHCFVNP
ncbi:MAG: hypothetical protein CBD74_03710, partial [Saprospirales bacterium TMED214]